MKIDIEFNRPKKYKLIEKIGAGACGETVLLQDSDLNINVVAKKFKPIVEKLENPEFFKDLMDRFKREAEILFSVNHPNIVRVYSYYSYPERDTAYILMEYVEGSGIVEYCKSYPTRLEGVFESLVEGFFHLESAGVLHRDIRPQNVLMTELGAVKIIDFGFGKELSLLRSISDKSISLNWWCETPEEFGDGKYDSSTEVYFVGKLFEECVTQSGRRDFAYQVALSDMCRKRRSERYGSFSDLRRQLSEREVKNLSFNDRDIGAYRSFAEKLTSVFASVGHVSAIVSDYDSVFPQLKELVQDVVLEEYLPSNLKLARIFVQGDYRYYAKEKVAVRSVIDFVDLIERLDIEHRTVVLRNLRGRLDALERRNYSDEEIPF